MIRGKSIRAWYREKFPSPGYLWLFCRVAAWTMVFIPVIYKFRSLPRFMKILTPREKTDQELTPELDIKFGLVNSYVVMILKNYPELRGRMCFRRSLVLYHFLLLDGVPARFVMGVRRKKDDHQTTSPAEQATGQNRAIPFQAPRRIRSEIIGHAWIEINGNHYRDEMAGAYHYFVTFAWPEEGPFPDEQKKLEQEINFPDLHELDDGILLE